MIKEAGRLPQPSRFLYHILQLAYGTIAKSRAENLPPQHGPPCLKKKKVENKSLWGFKGHLSAGQCPGHQVKMIQPTAAGPEIPENFPSRLQQWPVQIKLAPVQAPYFAHANLLVAADCTAFAFGDFHRRFIRNHIVLIGCPKLDQEDYAVKLTEIIRKNEIKSVTVVRMEVPCCGGIEYAVRTALKKSEKIIPWQVVTISIEGKIIES